MDFLAKTERSFIIFTVNTKENSKNNDDTGPDMESVRNLFLEVTKFKFFATKFISIINTLYCIVKGFVKNTKLMIILKAFLQVVTVIAIYAPKILTKASTNCRPIYPLKLNTKILK